MDSYSDDDWADEADTGKDDDYEAALETIGIEAADDWAIPGDPDSAEQSDY